MPYNGKEIILKVQVNKPKVQFYYGQNETNLKPIEEVQDYTLISDEVAQILISTYVEMYATSYGKK